MIDSGEYGDFGEYGDSGESGDRYVVEFLLLLTKTSHQGLQGRTGSFQPSISGEVCIDFVLIDYREQGYTRVGFYILDMCNISGIITI